MIQKDIRQEIENCIYNHLLKDNRNYKVIAQDIIQIFDNMLQEKIDNIKYEKYPNPQTLIEMVKKIETIITLEELQRKLKK